MVDSSTSISEDLDRISEHLEILGQLTPIELKQTLGLCTEFHTHGATCNPRYSLIVYIHSFVGWGPVYLNTNTPEYIGFGLPDNLVGRIDRQVPWPPALFRLFFP